VEGSDASLSFHIGRSRAHEHADTPHPLARGRRERPRGRFAAEKRDEGAASQWIELHSVAHTNSVKASSLGAFMYSW